VRPAIVGRIAGWPLKTYNPRERLVDDRLVLVGDATSLINPLSGKGIQYALHSGRWAAEAIVEGTGRGAADRRSPRLVPAPALEDDLRFDMAVAGRVVRLIRNRSVTPVWLEALSAIVARARRGPDYARMVGGIRARLLPATSALRGPT
jgi:flavin-dependent dehydrogenase